MHVADEIEFIILEGEKTRIEMKKDKGVLGWVMKCLVQWAN